MELFCSATRADFDALIDEPLPYRVRATAAERDGKLVGVGGLVFQADDTVAAFLVLAPGERGAKGFKLALHKAGLRMMAEARRLGIRRVVATAEHNNPAAELWLARLGFERAGEGVAPRLTSVIRANSRRPALRRRSRISAVAPTTHRFSMRSAG